MVPHPFEKCPTQKLCFCTDFDLKVGLIIVGVSAIVLGIVYGSAGYISCTGFGIFSLLTSVGYIAGGIVLLVGLCVPDKQPVLMLSYAWIVFILMFFPIITLVLAIIDRRCVIATYTCYTKNEVITYLGFVIYCAGFIFFDVHTCKYVLGNR